jgi:hypothetical protein
MLSRCDMIAPLKRHGRDSPQDDRHGVVVFGVASECKPFAAEFGSSFEITLSKRDETELSEHMGYCSQIARGTLNVGRLLHELASSGQVTLLASAGVPVRANAFSSHRVPSSR